LKVIEKRLNNIHLPTPKEFTHWRTKLDQKIQVEIKQAEALEPQLKSQNLSLDYVFFDQPELKQLNTMLNEWHCSLFAQELKTQFPVSEKRIKTFWKKALESIN